MISRRDSLAHCRVGEQGRPRVLQHHPAVFQHIAPIRQFERLVRVLLHQEDGHPLLAQLLYGVEDLLDDDGGQPQGGLVQQQQARLAHQGAADGQHLLFAAGHGASALLQPLVQAREQGEYLIQQAVLLGLVDEEGPHQQVLLHRQAGEDAAPLRHHGDVLAHDAGRAESVDLFPLEPDAAAAGLGFAAQCHQQGGLAGAVGADQGDDFPLFYLDADVVQRLNFAVVGRYVAKF